MDLATGVQFGVAAPQVFESSSSVLVHVESEDVPYELVIVRLGAEGNGDQIIIRPPVEHVVDESGSCLVGDLREYFRIRTDAVYSELDARQVFVVSMGDQA